MYCGVPYLPIILSAFDAPEIAKLLLQVPLYDRPKLGDMKQVVYNLGSTHHGAELLD